MKAKRKKSKTGNSSGKQISLDTILTDVKDTIIEIVTGKKVFNKNNEYLKDYYTISSSSVNQKKKSKYSIAEQIIFGCIFIIATNIIILLCRYLYAIANLRKFILCNSIIYMLPAIICPFITWLFSTNQNYFAFHKRKRIYFYLCSINAILVFFQPIYTFLWKLTVPHLIKIPLNPVFSDRMVIFLCHITIILLFSLSLALFYRQIEPLFTPTITRQIELFKLKHIVDGRKDREYQYDFKIIKNLENGKPIVTKQHDRFVQTEMTGPSGTGKTTTIFIGAICDDLTQKMINREKRQEGMMQMLLAKEAVLRGPLKEFDEEAVEAIGRTPAEKKKNQKKLEGLKKKYQDCGMTIVAPNAALITDIIRLALARNIKVNVYDPANSYEQYGNVKEVASNPFYIPLGLEEAERVIRISQASSVFADVLIATNQMGGQSDVYFTDISLAVSSNIAAVVMLAKNIQGMQAYFDDIHECISNFDNITPYVEIIEKHFNISVQASNISITSKTGKIDVDYMDSILKGAKVLNTKQTRKNPYYAQILFVKQELLGSGKEAMFSQARGLRNLVNKILQDPRIENKLSAGEDERIDFDRILSNNEITVVNTAIEFGQSISTSFGLFFLLLHRTSVLRRPQKTRTPHFLWIDECGQYVHPFFDDVIALYRQYAVAAVLSLQTYAQLGKHSATAYLKDVFLGAGTHIAFGRTSPDDMKTVSALSGEKLSEQRQFTQTSNDIFSSSPSYNESVRISEARMAVIEESDTRMLDFLELTINTINEGRVLYGQHGRVFFITEDAYNPQNIKEFLWEKACPEAFREYTEKDQDQKETISSKKRKIEIPKEEVILEREKKSIKKVEDNKESKIIEEQSPTSLSDLYLMLSKEDD